MDERHWIDYLTAIAAVATPVLVAFLAAVGWRLRTRLERQAALEDQLRSDRIEIYNSILEPFVLLLTTDAAWHADPKNKHRDKDQIAQQRLLSVDYRKQAFQLSLVGSDNVVKAYNNLMQFFYGRGETTKFAEADVKQMMVLLGSFLLEIRRSAGGDETELNSWDMLEWMFTDARKYRDAV